MYYVFIAVAWRKTPEWISSQSLFLQYFVDLQNNTCVVLSQFDHLCRRMTWTESITQFALKAVDVTMEAGGRFEAALPAQNWEGRRL